MFELLEPRRLLAADTLSPSTDLKDAGLVQPPVTSLQDEIGPSPYHTDAMYARGTSDKYMATHPDGFHRAPDAPPAFQFNDSSRWSTTVD